MIRYALIPLALWLVVVLPVSAQDASRLDQLFAALVAPETEEWQEIEQEIWAEWSKSDSAAMDLLLQRGRKALGEGDTGAAIAHFTALVDHAPDFAEGWNARATAYFQAGLYGPSIADIRRVLALEPRHFGALAGLGTMLEQIGELEGALAAYQAVLAIHPYRPDVKEAVTRLDRALLGKDI